MANLFVQCFSQAKARDNPNKLLASGFFCGFVPPRNLIKLDIEDSEIRFLNGNNRGSLVSNPGSPHEFQKILNFIFVLSNAFMNDLLNGNL
jgi:hypothetical protein